MGEVVSAAVPVNCWPSFNAGLSEKKTLNIFSVSKFSTSGSFIFPNEISHSEFHLGEDFKPEKNQKIQSWQKEQNKGIPIPQKQRLNMDLVNRKKIEAKLRSSIQNETVGTLQG